MISLVLFLLFVLALAGLVTWALHRDIKRAVARRKRREAISTLTVRLNVDISRFVAAMKDAAVVMSKAQRTAAAAGVSLQRYLEMQRPCRWCRALAMVGLSHHTRHRGKRRTAW